MAKISLKIQGIKGGNPTWKDDIGYISQFINGKQGDRIVSDAFEGNGISYKRRNKEIIEIYQDDKILFTGNFIELCEILKGK